MAKIFIAVASGTQNDKMIYNMSTKPMVKHTEILPGKAIDDNVDGWNFYCLDYGESTKLDTVKRIGQALQIHKKYFNDKGTIHRIMLAGNNITMDRFLEEAIEEVEDEVEDNEESEEGCDSMAVSDTDSEESDDVDSGMS